MRRWFAIVAIGLSPFLPGRQGSSASAAGTMSLQAVRVNGIAVPGGPSSDLQAHPNDVIEVEIGACGWAVSPQTQIKAIEVLVGIRAGATSSGCGAAIPTGWDAPLTPIACNGPPQCPVDFPVCAASGCEGPDHDPLGLECTPQLCNAYIDPGRTDSVIPAPRICERRAFDLNYVYGCVSLAAPVWGSSCDDPRYVGTFSLQLSSDACGTFRFEILPGTALNPLSYFLFASDEAEMASVRIPLMIHAFAPGDVNGDAFVDLADYALLYPAFLPQGNPDEDACPRCDLDHDGDTDLADFGVFQAAFTGAE